MKRVFQFHFLLLLSAGFILPGCKTSPTKPIVQGRAVEAGPALEQFLVAHGFHREGQQIYTRQYQNLGEAGKDLGVSMVGLPIPPNGTIMTERDERVFFLNGWGFTVLAEKGRTLDDPGTPCTVGTSLAQVR